MDNLKIYVRTPFYLERTLFYDLKTTILSFLSVYRSILTCVFRTSSFNTLQRLKAFTIILAFTLLRHLYPAHMYHSLKAQSLIRLYVLYSVLELAEKLIGTMVNDIARAIEEKIGGGICADHTVLEDESVVLGKSNIQSTSTVNLFDVNLTEEPHQESKGTNIKESEDLVENISVQGNDNLNEQQDRNFIASFGDIFCMEGLAFFFMLLTMMHTLLLYYQYLIIQLSLNSSSSVLYSLIISNQFLELKVNVTKKGDKKMLFLLIDHDGAKRFSLLIYLTVALLSIWTESEKLQFAQFICPIIIVFIFKILVDWFKHAFFCRYNNLNLNFYSDYKKEYIKGNNFVGYHILLIWMVYELIGINSFFFLFIFLGSVHFIGFFIK